VLAEGRTRRCSIPSVDDEWTEEHLNSFRARHMGLIISAPERHLEMLSDAQRLRCDDAWSGGSHGGAQVFNGLSQLETANSGRAVRMRRPLGIARFPRKRQGPRLRRGKRPASLPEAEQSGGLQGQRQANRTV